MFRTAVALTALSSLAGAFSPSDNFLVFVADDLGVDLVNAYREAPYAPPTPNIDALAGQGVLFRNAWAYARCSPGRATLQTGRYGFRTGIGTNVLDNGLHYALEPSETTIPEMLGPTYSSACFGKWHLHSDLVGGQSAPNLAGYSHYAGSMVPFRNGEDYFNHTLVVNGTALFSNEYATTSTVDNALQWIATAPEPWFCIVNFHQPHTPLHTPPPGLHSFPIPLLDPVTQVQAMVEAMDTELGRLLTSMDPQVHARTTVLFTADNGTAGAYAVPPYHLNHSKGTLYEGGVSVPLIVAGAAVQNPGREVGRPVCSADIFQTLADIAGVDTSALTLDSISFLPHLQDNSTWKTTRHFAFSERFAPNGPGHKIQEHRAIRNSRFKLIRRPDSEELYDLHTDPLELVNLIEVWEQNPGEVHFPHLKQYVQLSHRLDVILGS